MQIATIAGNLGKDAELKTTQGGDDFCRFSVAVTVERLHEVLELREDGRLFWKPRSNLNKTLWHREAFTTVKPSGYRVGCVDQQKLYAHRVVYAMHTGRWPTDTIDHINGDCGDNRPENLRDVPQSQNAINKPIPKNNVSGMIGVRFVTRIQKWCAQIKIGRKVTYLGSYETSEQALEARKAAERDLGFHINHGRVA